MVSVFALVLKCGRLFSPCPGPLCLNVFLEYGNLLSKCLTPGS